MTNFDFIKKTLIRAIESTSASGLYEQYPHPFLTPSLYSPHPLSKSPLKKSTMLNRLTIGLF